MLTEFELERRKSFVTATDVPAILGISKFKSVLDVYLEKTAPMDSWNGNAATEAGNMLEPTILKWAAERLGVQILDGGWREHDGGILACTLDGITMHGEPVEAKSHGIVGPTRWNEWGPDGSDEIPDTYAIQVQTQLLVTGASRGYVPALIGGRGFVMYEIEKHDIIHEMILRVVNNFWNNHVVPRIPPDGVANIEVIERLHRTPGKSIKVDDQLARDYLTASLAESEAKKAKEAAREALLSAFGDAEIAEFSGGRFEYVERKRKGYTVEPTTYRQLMSKKASGFEAKPETTVPDVQLDAMTTIDHYLSRVGYWLRAQSESGSRYWVCAGLPEVRVSDHSPNEQTRAWMEASDVFDVRTDRAIDPQLSRLSELIAGRQIVSSVMEVA